MRVEHDAYEWIGHEQHLIVKTDQIEQVEGDKHVTIKGDRNEKIGGLVSTISGTPVLINSGGAAGAGSGCSPDTPKLPKEAVDAEPSGITDLTGVSGPFENPQAQTLAAAAESGAPFCEKCAGG